MTIETFTYLIDAPDDGCVEDTAWLRIDQAPTATAAEIRFTKHHHDEIGTLDDDMRFRCDARVFLRAELTLYIGDEDEIEDVEKLVGADAIRHAAEHDRDSDLRFVDCDPTDDGAIEWWRLRLEPR